LLGVFSKTEFSAKVVSSSKCLLLADRAREASFLRAGVRFLAPTQAKSKIETRADVMTHIPLKNRPDNVGITD
jgi:hypothetical protein